MNFEIHAQGIRVLRTRFDRINAAALDASPAFSIVAEQMFAVEEKLFESQGRRGGGSWKRDTTEWLTRKMRLHLDPRINIASGALLSSLTVEGDDNMILDIGRNTLVFGSRLPYAATTQKNRPVIKFTPFDRARFRETIRDHLMASWKAA